MQTKHQERAQPSLQDRYPNAFKFPSKQKGEEMSAESFFMDDPFFTHSHFLWPRRIMALSGFREDFLRRRGQLIQSLRNEIRGDLLNELSQELHREFFHDQPSSPASRFLSSDTEQNKKRDLSFTLDTQGFSPEDVSVTVSGGQLEVTAAKQAEKEGSSSSTNTNGDSLPEGFVQTVKLPDHMDPSTLTCSLGEDGLLHIESPESKDQTTEEHVIPIRFRTCLNFPIKNDCTNTKEVGDEKSN